MRVLTQLTQPAVEPVSVEDCFTQLGLGAPTDNAQLAQQITDLIVAARLYCESITRTSFITRNWQYNLDDWPGHDPRYSDGHSIFYIPQSPLQSVISLQYVDVGGVVQTLTQDTQYGTNLTEPTYQYQLDPGADTRPARLMPPWARPWPPIRLVANAVMLQFKSGYGGPVTASMAAGSSILTGPVWNPGDVGQAINVPGAGPNGGNLVTTILAVDGNGQATLAAPAVAAVASVANNVWAGNPVPANICLAIKFMVQVLFEQGATSDVPLPRIVEQLLGPYKNEVS